jgi:O-antigen ligase
MATRARLATAGRLQRSTWATTLLAVVLALMVGLATAKLGSFQHQLKALIIVAAGLTVIVAALRPEVGLVVLLALMPLRLAFSGTSSDQVLLLSLAAVLVWRIRIRAVPTWALVGGVALVAGSFLAAVGSHNRSIALEGAFDWLGAIVILFVALSVLYRRRDASQRMVDIFLSSAVIVVIFGFLQKAGIDVIVGAPFTRSVPNSFLAFYTVYAGYLAMAATLATGEIVVALDQRRVARACIFGAALVVMLAALTSTTSRGGLIALAAGWVMLLVLNIQRVSIFARVIVILAIFAAAGYAVTPESTIATLEHRIAASNGRLGEDQTRSALHKAGEEALEKFPVGLGYGNFSYYLRSNVHNSKIGQAFFHAHETPVQVGLDAGWLGLAGFLTLWATPIIMVMRRRRGGASVVRATTCAAALTGLMAQGLYDYLFYDLAFLVFFVVMVWGVIHALSYPAISSVSASIE